MEVLVNKILYTALIIGIYDFIGMKIRPHDKYIAASEQADQQASEQLTIWSRLTHLNFSRLFWLFRMGKYIRYHLAQTNDDFEKCKAIIVEYLEILAIDLNYMDLPDEFATMDKKYGANEGALILALDGNEAIGCVGVRKIEPGIAELKRLYVRDSHRGLKVGVTLLEKALEISRNFGYRKIRLDVIPTLHKAKQLYQSFGFYEIPPYFNNPIEGTTYMEKVINGNP